MQEGAGRWAPKTETATPREEEGCRRPFSTSAQGGGGAAAMVATPQGGGGGAAFSMAQGGGGARNLLGLSARKSCDNPREEEGAVADPTAQGGGGAREPFRACKARMACGNPREERGSPLLRLAQGGGGAAQTLEAVASGRERRRHLGRRSDVAAFASGSGRKWNPAKKLICRRQLPAPDG